MWHARDPDLAHGLEVGAAAQNGVDERLGGHI